MRRAVLLVVGCQCLATSCSRAPPTPERRALQRSEQAGDGLGAAVARGPDVDGDGRDDVLVGAPQSATLAAAPGYVLVLSGADGEPLLRVQGAAAGDAFGSALLALPDVDGDGTGDFAVGAPHADRGGTEAGALAVHSGRDGRLLWEVLGERGGDRLGTALAGLGDLDGDGLDDLAVSAAQPATGPAHDTGPGYVLALGSRRGQRLFLAHGGEASPDLGGTLVAVGDLNDDGLPDLAAGCPEAQSILLLSGRTGSELGRVTDSSGGFGSSLAGGGDLDGDGVPDLLVGAPFDSHAVPLGGALHVLSGRDQRRLFIVRPGGTAGTRFGSALCALPDLDGDGRPDLAVASGSGAGVFLYSGAAGAPLGRVGTGLGAPGSGASLAACSSPGEAPLLAIGILPGEAPADAQADVPGEAPTDAQADAPGGVPTDAQADAPGGAVLLVSLGT